METFVIVTYCASDDAKKILGIVDDPQTNVGISQIMTTIIVAAKYFGGNHKLAQEFLYEHRYFHYKLSNSRFNRRVHAMPVGYFNELMIHFGEYAKMANESYEYSVDSFPIKFCENIRISRNKLFDPKRFRGFIASKRCYFLGIRVQMISTSNRLPVEFKIVPGAESDTKSVKSLSFNLPQGSVVYGDKAYSNYKFEDELKMTKNIELKPLRKKNSTRIRDASEENFIKRKRRSIESLFGAISNLLPKKIHAVTAVGFLKKAFCFILAHCMGCYRVAT